MKNSEPSGGRRCGQFLQVARRKSGRLVRHPQDRCAGNRDGCEAVSTQLPPGAATERANRLRSVRPHRGGAGRCQDALAELQADPRGVLTVTAPTSSAALVMPCELFLQQYPQIELELHLTDQWVDFAAQRGMWPCASQPADSDLSPPLAPMRRCVCASPGYLAQHGRPADCRPDAAPLPDRGATRRRGFWSFAGVRVAAVARARSLAHQRHRGLLRAAVDGLGIVHLASWLVCDMLAAGKLVELFPGANAPANPSPSAIHAVRLPVARMRQRRSCSSRPEAGIWRPRTGPASTLEG